LAKIWHHDWKHSHLLDLTDEGLLEEMKAHNQMKGAEKLVLESAGKKGEKKKSKKDGKKGGKKHGKKHKKKK